MRWKNIACKWKAKAGQGVNTYIRQNNRIIKMIIRANGQYIREGSIQVEDITITNIYIYI